MDAMYLSREMLHEQVINIKAAIDLSGTLASTVAPLSTHLQEGQQISTSFIPSF
jgi:hypothetical protein